jgi:hypothetical protein
MQVFAGVEFAEAFECVCTWLEEHYQVSQGCKMHLKKLTMCECVDEALLEFAFEDLLQGKVELA